MTNPKRESCIDCFKARTVSEPGYWKCREKRLSHRRVIKIPGFYDRLTHLQNRAEKCKYFDSMGPTETADEFRKRVEAA